MKKLSLILLIPAFLFASCVKEEVSQDVLGNQIVVKATVEEFGSETKAAVSDLGVFNWQIGDYITAYNENESIKSNGLSEDGSSNATFAFTGWNADYSTAIYPGDVTLSEGKLELPSQRTWKANDATPVMYATLENSTYDFMHVGGVVKVTVKNVPEEARKFVFYTPGFAINGEFALADDNGVKSINTSKTNNETLHSYTLTFSATDITDPMAFYVPLPVGTYTTGFNFKLYDENNSEVGAAGGSTSQNVSRRALLKMPVVTLVGGTGEDVTVNTTIDNASNALETSNSISISEIESKEGQELPVIILPTETDGKEVNIAFESITTSETIAIEAENDDVVSDDVNISVPSNSNNANLTINLPTSTVTIAPSSDSESVIDKVTATTADNTLIIEDKITINTLEVVKGNIIIKAGAIINNWTRPTGYEHKGQIYVEEGAQYPETELSGYEVITPDKIVAEADGVGYTNIPDAIAKVKEGGTVTLKQDVTLKEILTINKNITLSGENHKITSSAGRAINISGAQNVTIQNLTVDASGERAINIIQNSKKIIIENVTATSYNYTVNIASSAPGAEVTISQSTLTGKNTVNVAGAGAIVRIKGGTVNCVDDDSTIGEDYAALSLNKDAVAGSIVASGCTINVTEGSDSTKGSNGAENGSILIDDSTDGVEIIVAVYDNENSDYYYSFTTISEAVEFAKGETTIRLIRDVNLTEPIIITEDKDITLDLNGKTVTATSKKAFEVYGNATIKNGNIVAVNRCVDTRKNVNLTLTNVSLTANKYSDAYGNPQPLTIGGSDNGTMVTMNNVTIDAGTAGYGIITFVKTELVATEANISGYSALYVKPGSDDSTFSFTNSTLEGSTFDNDVEGNSFSTVAVRANKVTVYTDPDTSVISVGYYYYAMSLGGTSENEKTTTGVNITFAGKITGNILPNADNLVDNTVKVNADYKETLVNDGYNVSDPEDGLITILPPKE